MAAPTSMRLANAKGALVLVCVKCTREATFPAEDRRSAEAMAAGRGWQSRNEKTICPKCK